MEHTDSPGTAPPRRAFLRITVAVALVLLLPLAGAGFAGKPLKPYLRFPPRAPDLPHEPFSWPVFLGFSLFIAASTVPVFRRLLTQRILTRTGTPARPFPWWGWAGVAFGAVAWVVAWSRFPWMGTLQAHTFTPLWLAYILVVNAFTMKRTGRCPMLSRPRRFLLLFAASAGFWWTFEYLNRFVGNWRYAGAAEFGAAEYFLFATLPFSTVLPAVLSTRELLLSFPGIDAAFREWRPLFPRHPRAAGAFALLFSCAGLLAVGVVPDLVFPLVWIAPPLLAISLAALRGEPHALSRIASGDWRAFIASSLAALVCGFFWEMWNYGSFVKWVYAIPYVDAFHVFELPLLGYAGYLPFGVLCAEVGDRVLRDSVPG